VTIKPVAALRLPPANFLQPAGLTGRTDVYRDYRLHVNHLRRETGAAG
jgi:hypothetical protein